MVLIHRKTEEKIEKHPLYIKKGQVEITRLELIQADQIIRMESFKWFPRLEQFRLHDEGRTVSIDKVHDIID
jgi:translation elongation factor EF-1alpha